MAAKIYQIIIPHPRFFTMLMIALVLSLIAFVGININQYYNSNGKYDYVFNIISVYPKDYTLSEIQFISTHEGSHKVWFKDLSDSQRDAYTKIFEDSNEFVTDYAKTNSAEDFAETIAANTLCVFYVDYVSEDRKKFFEDLEMPGMVKNIDFYAD